ncbi:MAG: T9SS type A sorting domain-containing protein [Sphingobacteriales bacterium]|nr:MAG: T9SS type A sorting domain-containing protein [Sphingobacteriales bacterium]
MKNYLSIPVLTFFLCGSATAQNYNVGPLHVNGAIYDASAVSGSYLSTNSRLSVGSGGTWLLNNSQFQTPRIGSAQTEVITFTGGTYSRTTGYVNGYAAANSQGAGFVLPIGQSTYRPLTVNTSLASGNTISAAWYDLQPQPSTHINGIQYYFLPGYYDVNTVTAGVSVTPTAPVEAISATRLVGTADGVNFVDIGPVTTAAVLPEGSYQLRFANSSTALPLTLTAFTAIKQGNTGILSWKISSEQGVDQYTIERSADGRRFTAISSVPSQGNSVQELVYSLTDISPLKGANYYRLKTIERDGKISYSAVRLLSFDGNLRIVVYPNPTSDKATITGLEAGMQVTLLGLRGQFLSRQKASGNVLTMDMKQLPSAVYEVQVQDANGQTVGSYRVVRE